MRRPKRERSYRSWLWGRLWSRWLLTRKHCPEQIGRYPGFHPPPGTFSDVDCVQWCNAGGVLGVIYSCATAHDLHVIPSWPPVFAWVEPNCRLYQSAVASAGRLFRRPCDANAKIRYLCQIANCFVKKMYLCSAFEKSDNIVKSLCR